MKKFKSSLLEELSWRGFLAQMTHEKELDEALASENIASYIGFDCTAPSLHVGSLIQIMILRLLQRHNHKPIVLLGGATTKIGDPSGKDEARQMLDEDTIQGNLEGIYGVLSKFIDFEGDIWADMTKNADGVAVKSAAPEIIHDQGKRKNIESGALLVNNDDWMQDIGYIEFLRDVGRHFSLNRMLSFESVKLRLDRDQPLSFLEFNYMILQAYDFYVLHRDYGCKLQIGGSDQWGNIVNGVELIRRIGALEGAKDSDAFGLTSPLLTTSDGKKMGKTADGAVWLDENMFKPYDYFQYFRNVDDADVVRFLKLFTDLEREEIAALEKLQGQEINKAKEVLALEATKICHGEAEALRSLEKAREIFVAKNKNAYEEREIKLGGAKKLVEIMKEVGACESNSQARRLIEGGGVKIDDEVVKDANLLFGTSGEFNLQVGKKKFFKIKLR